MQPNCHNSDTQLLVAQATGPSDLSPSIVIELAGEPQGKGRPRFARATGRAYTPGQTVKYEAQLRYAAQQAMGTRQPLEGALEVVITAHMPVPASWSRKRQQMAVLGELRPTTRPDADNILKMLDALNGIVFRDDKQIVWVAVGKHYSPRPRLHIEARQIAGGST